MSLPILVLQYPDSRAGRTVALAATRNIGALRAFKAAVLEAARLASMDWMADEVLAVHETMEMERLERLLNMLIPDDERSDESESEDPSQAQ